MLHQVDQSTFLFFFFNDTATTEIYTLSLHDALPIWNANGLITMWAMGLNQSVVGVDKNLALLNLSLITGQRSEEHTSELQSRQYLVCRLLLEKKKKNAITTFSIDILRTELQLSNT